MSTPNLFPFPFPHPDPDIHPSLNLTVSLTLTLTPEDRHLMMPRDGLEFGDCVGVDAVGCLRCSQAQQAVWSCSAAYLHARCL